MDGSATLNFVPPTAKTRMRAFPNTREALPGVGEDGFGGADEHPQAVTRAAGVGGGEGDENDPGIGEGDTGGDGRPAGEGRTLQVEEQEDASEKAFDAGAFAEFRQRPGGREAGALLGTFGVPGAPTRSGRARAPKTVWIQRIRARPQ